MNAVFEQYHLTVNRDGDTFLLRQVDHSGNEEGVALHISQIRHLAEVAGLLPGESCELATLRRRMLTLHSKLIDLIGHFAWDDLFGRSAYADDLFKDVDLVGELANEFVAELLETGNGKGESSERNENPHAISVTPEVTKCGRPATGEAMSNAERQAKHRAKQKDSPQRELGGI